MVVIGLALYQVMTTKPPPDQEQIARQIENARSAAENRSVNGIFHAISANYIDSEGHNVDQLHFILTRALRDSGQLTIALSPPNTNVAGDTATSLIHAHIVSQQNKAAFDTDVTLHWRREDGTRFLILPAKTWRVVGADYNSPDE